MNNNYLLTFITNATYDIYTANAFTLLSKQGLEEIGIDANAAQQEQEAKLLENPERDHVGKESKASTKALRDDEEDQGLVEREDSEDHQGREGATALEEAG